VGGPRVPRVGSGGIICPVCQSTDVVRKYGGEITSGKDISFSYTFSPEHSKTLDVYSCNACTHKFSHPIPEDIGVNYKDVVDDEYLKHQTSRQLTARKVLRTLTAHRRGGKLVDVGCATGDFVEVANQSGFDAEGLEPCAWSAGLARRRGLTVHQELLNQFADEHPGEYDVATLWGVIEHFADPGGEVERLAKILKPGGLLAIWTGDVDSIVSRILKRKWWYWQGQHIQYFTHKSLEHLLRTSGLEVVDSKLYPFAASYETLFNSLKRYHSHRALTFLSKPFFALRAIWYLYLPGEMFVIARKVGKPSSSATAGSAAAQVVRT
jgi:ubiquinone/menaquinone biosynthesis C-methylase UbiE